MPYPRVNFKQNTSSPGMQLSYHYTNPKDKSKHFSEAITAAQGGCSAAIEAYIHTGTASLT